MLRHCSVIPSVKPSKQSRLSPGDHPSHIPYSSADISAAHSYSPCLDYLPIPLIHVKHHWTTGINISAQEGSKRHSTGQLCVSVWIHSTRCRVPLQWSRNPWSPKWKILLASLEPNLSLQLPFILQLCNFCYSTDQAKETSRDNLLGTGFQGLSPHSEICGEMKCTTKEQLTRILITLVFIPQFFFSSIFWKRSRIQGLVAEAWGNREREVVGSLSLLMPNYQTRWIDGWMV